MLLANPFDCNDDYDFLHNSKVCYQTQWYGWSLVFVFLSRFFEGAFGHFLPGILCVPLTWYLIIVFHGQSSFTFCQMKNYLPSFKIKDSKRNCKGINNRCCKILVLLSSFLAVILTNTVLNTYPNGLCPGTYRIVCCVSSHCPRWGNRLFLKQYFIWGEVFVHFDDTNGHSFSCL